VTLSANVNINYRHIRIEINHGSMNVFQVLTKLLSRRCQKERQRLPSFDPWSVCKLFTF
jgi:hypothetical protein